MKGNKTAEEMAEMKEQYYEESYIAWLSASDDVVKKIKEFAIAFDAYSKEVKNIENENKGKACLQNLILSMRRDLMNNTRMSNNDFLITDVI